VRPEVKAIHLVVRLFVHAAKTSSCARCEVLDYHGFRKDEQQNVSERWASLQGFTHLTGPAIQDPTLPITFAMWGTAGPLGPFASDVNLLCELDRVIEFDAELTNGGLDL
jgi:hypothetical protein